MTAIETVLMRISFVSRLIRALYVIPAPDASACGLNRFLMSKKRPLALSSFFTYDCSRSPFSSFLDFLKKGC